MKISTRLKNIQPELNEISSLSSENHNTDIVFVIETGKIIEEDEKKINEIMENQEGHYDHRPRQFISIYPNICAMHSLMNSNDLRNGPLGGVEFSEMIDDMIRQVDSKFISKPRHEELYSDIILELDSNYVKRLNDLKSGGVDILYHLKRDILTAIQDIKDDYTALSKRIIDNIMTKVYSDKYIIKRSHHKDNSQKMNGFRFLIMLDLILAWYINHKIVQQKVLKNDIFEVLDEFLKVINQAKPERRAFLLKVMTSGFINSDEKIINIVIKRTMMELYDNESEDTVGLKYRPMYVEMTDDNKCYIKNEIAKRPDDNQLYSECSNNDIAFDLSIPEVVRFISECYVIGSENLIQEGVLRRIRDIFKKSDNDMVIDVARKIDQVDVEFQFMYDRYSKTDAMNKAYDVLETIEKAYSKTRDRKTKEVLDDMKNQLLIVIKDGRDRNVREERLTINIDYPKGYEG